MLQASFSIAVNFLAVKFTDTSTIDGSCTISSWAWDFGDTNTATTQSPTHTFSTPGKFTVTLIVTDNDGNTSTAIRYILVDTKLILPVSVEDLVKLKLPYGFPYQAEQISANIAIWQMFMQPLINTPGVADSDVYNELAYPPIVNALIGYIIAYEIMLDYITGTALTSLGEGGAVKKIETGPSNTEFQDPAALLKALNGKDGILNLVKQQMCALAFRSMVNIQYCPALPIPKFIPLKSRAYTPFTYSTNCWYMNPFDIIITL